MINLPEDLQERIAAYIDGELPPAEAARLEVFLANTDPTLAEQVLGMIADRQRLRRVPRSMAPRDLAARVMEQIERTSLLHDVEHLSTPHRRWWQSRGALAAGLLLVIGGFSYFVVISVFNPSSGAWRNRNHELADVRPSTSSPERSLAKAEPAPELTKSGARDDVRDKDRSETIAMAQDKSATPNDILKPAAPPPVSAPAAPAAPGARTEAAPAPIAGLPAQGPAEERTLAEGSRGMKAGGSGPGFNDETKLGAGETLRLAKDSNAGTPGMAGGFGGGAPLKSANASKQSAKIAVDTPTVVEQSAESTAQVVATLTRGAADQPLTLTFIPRDEQDYSRLSATLANYAATSNRQGMDRRLANSREAGSFDALNIQNNYKNANAVQTAAGTLDQGNQSIGNQAFQSRSGIGSKAPAEGQANAGPAAGEYRVLLTAEQLRELTQQYQVAAAGRGDLNYSFQKVAEAELGAGGARRTSALSPATSPAAQQFAASGGAQPAAAAQPAAPSATPVQAPTAVNNNGAFEQQNQQAPGGLLDCLITVEPAPSANKAKSP